MSSSFSSSLLSPSLEIASSSSANGSRRKQPLRHVIPVLAMGFGGCDEVAAAEKEEVEREGDGLARKREGYEIMLNADSLSAHALRTQFSPSRFWDASDVAVVG
ncbi:hypothetical protein LINPERHAP2_LOCUS2574 [Linum perenne]